MKVWEISDAFGLENLTIVDRPVPEPGPMQVLVRMRAASINFRDLVVVQGTYGGHITPPLVPLSDGVGEIAALGPGVTRVKVGDRVAPTFFQAWAAGAPGEHTHLSTLGGPHDGTLGEYMVCAETGVATVPDHMTDEEAACLPCAALTAWSALVTYGRIAANDTVLIQGTGGVALFALQIAKMHGARVIITSSSDEKLARAKELGADFGINYRTTPKWAKAARIVAGAAGIDHVIEVGGAKTFAEAIKAVKVGGRISLIGVLSGAVGEFNLPLVLMRNICVQGVTVGSLEGFETMAKAMDFHGTRPVVDRVFPFDEARAAFDYVASGQHFGKVAVSIP